MTKEEHERRGREEAVMPRINGRPFRCEDCGANVFHWNDKPNGLTCNGCGATYVGEA